MTHPDCTAAEVAARNLIEELTKLRDRSLHPWQHDGDLFEAHMILQHIHSTSADLHLKAGIR